MMPAPVDDRSDTGHSRWLAAGRAQARSRRSRCRHRTASLLANWIVLSDMLNSFCGKPIAAIAGSNLLRRDLAVKFP